MPVPYAFESQIPYLFGCTAQAALCIVGVCEVIVIVAMRSRERTTDYYQKTFVHVNVD